MEKACFLVLIYLATARAAISGLDCFEDIFGCGVGVFGSGQAECCTCLENYPETDSLSIIAHCANQEALESPATCCPCSFSLATLSDGNDFLDCIKPRNIKQLVKRFEGTRQFIRDAVKACNGHLRDDCAPPDFNRTLRQMVDKVDEVDFAIRVDCGNIEAPPCSSESSSGSSSR
ncbi:uncharacterized protein LOC135469636 [Liolophura sinensis]|uniref:uncharacterized protein LOC135469636 n=1 Tax=Liolophura sinensis TaxID=3198878 RepID=UPI0031580E3B